MSLVTLQIKSNKIILNKANYQSYLTILLMSYKNLRDDAEEDRRSLEELRFSTGLSSSFSTAGLKMINLNTSKMNIKIKPLY